jgi:CubicO group peptidase (beta-lactamase class C family)
VGNTIVNTSAIDPTSDITSSGAAGAMVMSVPDMVTWGEAFLRDARVVTAPLATTALHVAPGGTGLGVLGFSETDGFCVFADGGCPAGASFRAVGGSGVAAGTRSVLLYDRPRDSVVALAINRDGTPGIEKFVVQVLRDIEAAEH